MDPVFGPMSNKPYKDDYDSYDDEPVLGLFPKWTNDVIALLIKVLRRCDVFLFIKGHPNYGLFKKISGLLNFDSIPKK